MTTIPRDACSCAQCVTAAHEEKEEAEEENEKKRGALLAATPRFKESERWEKKQREVWL